VLTNHRHHINDVAGRKRERAAPGYCWYYNYTDPGKTQGFWDVCP